MKAAFLNQTGPADVIQYADLPDPVAGPGQVIVRTEAMAVNPIDVYLRSGAVAADLPMPYIPGCDLAGTVVDRGEGFSRFQVGDRVWGSNQGLAGRQGTFSELCCVDEQWLYPLPDGVDAATAAAVSLTGITAHLGLFLHADLQPGERVFVNGGTGGVGSAVIQLVAAAGGHVTTTVGSAEKEAQAISLGAADVINYRSTDVAARLAELVAQAGPFHVWFETLRNPQPETTIPLLAKRGRYILMAGRDARPEFPVGPFYVNDLRAIGFAMFNASPDEQRDSAMKLNALLAAGQLKGHIGAEFPLAEAAAAHQLQEDNTLHGAGTLSGKIVIRP